MLCGEIVGMLVGMGVGLMLGMEPFQIFFFIILPIMAGGVGEGAIPLSIGYATLLHMDQGVALGRVLPMVMLGGLTAIIISGCLNQLGKRFPHLTGEGQLMPNRSNGDEQAPAAPAFSGKTDVTTIAAGALLAVLLYMIGMLGHKLIGLPAPVGMLFIAVLIKLVHGVSPRLLEGSQVVYKFFQTSVTYPILFAVGVAITPWEELVHAFTINNLLVIVSTVSALVATGFFVGKRSACILLMWPSFPAARAVRAVQGCCHPDGGQPHEPDAVCTDCDPYWRRDQRVGITAGPWQFPRLIKHYRN